jgi:signal transduction histidine kinase
MTLAVREPRLAQLLHWRGATMHDVLTPEQLREAYEERVRRLTETVEGRERWLAVLSAVAVRTHAVEDTREILDIALSEILGRFGLKAGWVFMGRQDDRKLHFAAAQGVSQQYLDTVEREGLEDCLCPEVFWTGHRMEARNTTQCPRMPTIVEGLQEPVAHACIPLRFEGETRGVLNVAARPGERFGEDDLRFLETLGHQVCVAIERARHLQAERRRNEEARAMAAINKAIGGSLDARTVLAAVGRSALEILEADRVQVFLGASPADMVVAHLAGRPHPELVEGQPLDLVASGAEGHCRALQMRSVLQVNDWRSDPRVNPHLARRWAIASGIVLPLVAGERTLGLLALTRQEPRPWTPEQFDVAESMAVQASIALENARLYAESRSAFEHLKNAQEKLLENQKMAVLGTFASGLAHEIRNPLNSIGLQLSILERRIKRLDSEVTGELQQLAEVIRSEISRLDSLVGDFLLFSRTKRFHYRPTSLDALVDDVLKLLRPEAEQAQVILQRGQPGPERLPDVPVDAEKMKQVVINLVRNAIEAVGMGGRVSVETSAGGGRVRLLVRDDGPGLPPGLDVFQLFVTTKPRGTGLGLSIVQQIVSEHGGEVGAASGPGGGTIFTVSLPAEAATETGEES